MLRKITAVTALTLFTLLTFITAAPAKSRLPENFTPGAIPAAIDFSYLRNNPPGRTSGMDRKADIFPKTYDMRDYNRLPTVRDQNPWGTCWAHSALGSMESNFLTKRMGSDIDLSEFHLAWYTYGDGRKGKYFELIHEHSDILDQGGNVGRATALLSRTGAILEEKLPYPNYKKYVAPSSVVPESLKYLPFDYYLADMYRICISPDLDMNTVKKNVMENGAVYVSYYAGQGATSPEGGTTAYFDNSHEYEINHAVLIVGWDDDFSRENFNDNDNLRPKANGAWLIRNSWGDTWPYPDGDGYFWMSYEQFIGEAAAFFIGKNPSEGITRHYGYDDLGQTDSTGEGKTCWAANVFRSVRDEYIRRVGFYTTDNNASCMIRLYKLGSEFPESPVDGTLLWTASADFDYAGYHTVNMPHITSSTKDLLKKGDYFSVVIKFTNPENENPIAIEKEMVYSSYVVVNENESYISTDGKTWQDMKHYKKPNGAPVPANACIKAFTFGDDYPEDEAMPPQEPDIPDDDIPYYEEDGRDGLSWETAYVIDSSNDIELLRNRVRNGKDNELFYKLDSDIDLTEETKKSSWRGIGYANPFKGHFDGNGHNIGIEIKLYGDSATDKAALFERVKGSVMNLNVTGNVSVPGQSGKSNWAEDAAGIVWQLEGGRIINCTFSGNISAGDGAGIVGRIESGTVEDCTFSGTIEITRNDYYKYSPTAGGIAGYLIDGSIKSCKVSDNSSVSSVTKTKLGYMDYTRAGGIVGAVFGGTVTGNVSGAEISHGDYKGGIAGYVDTSKEGIVSGISGNSWPGDYHQFGNCFDDGTEFKPTVITESLRAGKMNASYGELQLDATGLEPITWKADNLPYGMSCSKAGIISGTPKKSGSYDVKISVSNNFGTGYKTLTLVIENSSSPAVNPPTITTKSLKAGTSLKKYSATLKAKTTKGTSVTWSASGLPAGFSIDSKSGKITGTTQYSGTYRVTISATNSGGTTSSTMPLTIKPVAPTVKVTKSSNSKVGTEYSTVFTASGTQPITWSIEGDLPDGLTFSDGKISGTPREVFKGSVKVTASNAAKSVTKSLSLKITGTAPKILTKSLPAVMAGQSYSASLEVSGSPYIMVTVTGLPHGVTFDASKMKISGTPSTKGTYSVKVVAINAVKKASKTLKLKVTKALSFANYGHDERGSLPSFLIAAELPEVSFDEEGMYDFSVTIGDNIPEGAELVYIAGSDEPSEDDSIVEFFDDDGDEISAVPENRIVMFSAWFREGVTYRPIIAVMY